MSSTKRFTRGFIFFTTGVVMLIMSLYSLGIFGKGGAAGFKKEYGDDIVPNNLYTYLNKEEVPEERIEKERAILTEQAENEGLDSNKLPMIVNGRLNKFFEEVCLVDQGFIKENKMKVSKYVESKKSKINCFVRYEVGEGIEKREENFADEVMKQISQ